MASCLSGGGGRACHVDIVKPVSSSPARSSHSSPSSTLSESNSSNSTNSSISLKKPRAPRKRPNQTYNEAAALLSSLYPSIFNPKKSLRPIHKQHKSNTKPPNLDISSLDEQESEHSVLLPPFPVPGPAAFLLHDPVSSPASESVQGPVNPFSNWVKRYSFREPVCSPVSSPGASSVSNEVIEIEDDFDTESILDEESGNCGSEGIDSIMGNLSVDSNSSASLNLDSTLLPNTGNLNLNPYVRDLVGLGLCSKLEHLNRAFKNRGGNIDWWHSHSVPVNNIFTELKPVPVPAPPPPAKKKSKKKKSERSEKERREKEEGFELASDAKLNSAAVTATTQQEKSCVKLGLKLSHDDVLKAWSDRGPMFSADTPDSPRPSAETLAKLADIDLFPESEVNGGIREASVMRYKEKRRTRLFSKKIRYQVRKVNADRRPRMKGRFVRSPFLLQQALEEGG